MLVVLCWTLALQAARGEAPDVTLELRYPMAEAGEVVLIWGIDDWHPVAEAVWPPNTSRPGPTLHTVMDRQGDVFVARLQVPVHHDLDYGFLITKDRDGEPCESVWDGDRRRPIGGVDAVIDERPTVILQRSAPAPAPRDAPLIEQEIRYRLPQAGEVSLIWGINRWRLPPPRMRPAGTTIMRRLARTPMTRVGDVFSARVSVPEGTVIDFIFKITALQSGVEADVDDNRWYNQFAEEGGAYRVVARADGPIEIEAGPPVIDRLFAWTFRVSLAGLVAIALVAAVLFTAATLGWRRARTWPLVRQVKTGLDRARQTYRLPAAAVGAIVWAPFVIAFVFPAYLAVGFRQSPFLADVLAEDFRFAEGNRFVYTENSPVEMLTFGLLLAGGLLGLWLALRIWRWKRDLLASSFYALFSIGVLVVAMEEVAWGQWLFGFEPPESVQALNSQKELTLHNLGEFQGRSEYLEMLFALGGLVGIALTALGLLPRIGPSLLLLPWLLVIALFAGLDLANDYVAINVFIDWGVRQLAEITEMMIGVVSFLFVWLNARRLAVEWRREDDTGPAISARPAGA